jgi:hypothetical protein
MTEPPRRVALPIASRALPVREPIPRTVIVLDEVAVQLVPVDTVEAVLL